MRSFNSLMRSLYVAVIAGYTLLAVAALWALVSDIGGMLPDGPGTDYDHFIWNYWWMGEALAQGVSPWYSDYVLYPHMHNLSLHTMTPLWFPVYALLEPLVGRVAVLNGAIAASFVLTGTLTFAWLRRLRVLPVVAFVGGLAFAFQPYVLWSASKSHLNLLALWWFPLTLLLWHEIVAPARLRRPFAALLLGFAFWGCWLSDFQYALQLPLILGAYGLWTLWANRHERAWIPLVGWGAVALGIMAALMLIWPLPPLLETDTSDPNVYPPAGLTTARTYALPPESLVGLAENNAGQTLGRVFVAMAWGGLLVYAARRVRDGRDSSPVPAKGVPPRGFWLLIAVPPLLLMLGPDAFIGETRIRLPYSWLHEALNGQYRTPERFVFPAAFALATFAAVVWSPLMARLRLAYRLAAIGGVAALLVVDYGALDPFPVQAVRDYPIHHEIGAEDGDYVILDVPAAADNGWTALGPTAGRYALFYAPVHEKRVVNGFLARMPYGDFAFYADSPLFTWLAGARSLADEADAAAAAAEFARYVEGWPVGYVFAHRYWLSDAQQNTFIGWLNTQPGLCDPAIAADGELIWWRTAAIGCGQAHPTGSIAIGQAEGWLHIGPGWYGPEDIGGPVGRWTQQEAVMRVTLEPDTAYTLEFTALAYHRPRAVTIAGQTVNLSNANWADYSVTLPAGSVPDGLLVLAHDSADVPAEVSDSPDQRRLAAAYTRFTLTPVE